jgi:hypothetical protein
MRTATTIAKNSGGEWVLLAGPDKPADKQRLEFNNIGLKWPKDVVEIRFQQGDGPAKTKSKAKAESQAKQTAAATAHAEDTEVKTKTATRK